MLLLLLLPRLRCEEARKRCEMAGLALAVGGGLRRRGLRVEEEDEFTAIESRLTPRLPLPV
jgi:hypothetical protein